MSKLFPSRKKQAEYKKTAAPSRDNLSDDFPKSHTAYPQSSPSEEEGGYGKDYQENPRNQENQTYPSSSSDSNDWNHHLSSSEAEFFQRAAAGDRSFDESSQKDEAFGNEENSVLRRQDVIDQQTSADQTVGQRAKYNAKIDRFLNNGILIVGVLLIMVLLIAFLA